MLPVTEGLLVAVLGTHLVLLVFVAWQIAQCLRRVALHIRRARRLAIAIAGMDCDELIDELMSVGADAGLAEGAPLAAAPVGGTAATPDAPEEEERAQKHWWSVGKHSPPIKSTLWTIPKSRSFTPATNKAWGGDDEDAGVCGAPALCQDRGHVSPDRKPARAQSPTSREIPLSDTRLAAPPASYITVLACS